MPTKPKSRRKPRQGQDKSEIPATAENQGRTGRPSSYNDEQAGRILLQIATAKNSLRTICEVDGLPDVSTVLRWLRDFPDFRAQYALAKQEQAELLVEEMLEIADDGTNDTYTTEEGEPRTDTDVIQRSKLRVDTRKWLASKLLPKKYGEKIEMGVEHSGAMTVNVITEGQRAKIMELRRAATAGVN